MYKIFDVMIDESKPVTFDDNNELKYTEGKTNLCVTLDTKNNLECSFAIKAEDIDKVTKSGYKERLFKKAKETIKQKVNG